MPGLSSPFSPVSPKDFRYKKITSALDTSSQGKTSTHENPSVSLEPMDSEELEKLLSRVNMQAATIHMEARDEKLIYDMRDTIKFQQSVIKKREKLVYAITHNVQHVANLHKKQAAELRDVKEENEKLKKAAQRLTLENKMLMEQVKRLS